MKFQPHTLQINYFYSLYFVCLIIHRSTTCGYLSLNLFHFFHIIRKCEYQTTMRGALAHMIDLKNVLKSTIQYANQSIISLYMIGNINLYEYKYKSKNEIRFKYWNNHLRNEAEKDRVRGVGWIDWRMKSIMWLLDGWRLWYMDFEYWRLWCALFIVSSLSSFFGLLRAALGSLDFLLDFSWFFRIFRVLFKLL